MPSALELQHRRRPMRATGTAHKLCMGMRRDCECALGARCDGGACVFP